MKKKIFKLLIILTFPILVFGCGRNVNPENISNAILDSFKNYYNTPSLNSEEKKIYDAFIEQEKKENKIVELTDYFNEQLKSDEPDTYGVFEENGKYYIKYDDIDWDEAEADDDTGSRANALVVANGYIVYLSIEDTPILYEDEHYEDDYSYSYLGTETTTEYIKMYYKSQLDSKGLIIQYNKENNKIKNVNLVFEQQSSYKEEEKENSNVSNIVEIAALLVGVLFVAYFLIKFLKSRK